MSHFNIQRDLGPPIAPSDAHEHYLWGVERVKRFVNLYLHCIFSILKKMSKMSMFLPLEKFLRAPMFTANCIHVTLRSRKFYLRLRNPELGTVSSIT